MNGNNPKIICLCHEPGVDNTADFWLPKIESAAEKSLKILKNDSAKLTLKTHLEPWGEVCLQGMKWEGMKKGLSLFRKTSGRISWDLSSDLRQHQIPITEQLLYLEIRKRGFVNHTYQISRWLEGYNLGEMARDRNEKADSQLVDLLGKAVKLIARLHSANIIHGDLKWSNFLYVPSHEQELILTDLDHIKKSKSSATMGKDLARFILSATEFDMAFEVEEKLIEEYSEACKGRFEEIERSLCKRLQKKKDKYEKRRLTNLNT